VLLRYVIDACGGIDGLAITHLDRLSMLPDHVCDSYELDGVRRERITLSEDPNADPTLGRDIGKINRRYRQLPFSNELAWIAVVQELLQTPVRYRSVGPTFRDKR
jgi:adenylosuccinate synthase